MTLTRGADETGSAIDSPSKLITHVGKTVVFDGVCSLASLYRAPFISFRNPVSSKRSYHFSTVSVCIPSLRAKESRVADRMATLRGPAGRVGGGEREDRVHFEIGEVRAKGDDKGSVFFGKQFRANPPDGRGILP